VGKTERMDNKISFIGVGPGDPELLTLKALKKIKIADVIIWTDSLIPEKILDSAKEGSEKNKNEFPQLRANHLNYDRKISGRENCCKVA
jgi:precorrin-4 methylase